MGSGEVTKLRGGRKERTVSSRSNSQSRFEGHAERARSGSQIQITKPRITTYEPLIRRTPARLSSS